MVHQRKEPSAFRERPSWNIIALLSSAAVIRLALIAYGEWQDRHMLVKYTDIDYLVFTDAASFVAAGKSPYLRYTYRYSPLLAYILVPNTWGFPAFGKVVFSMADILTGWLTYTLVRLRGTSETASLLCAAAWLYNPFTFSIGTRGNCEALVSALLLGMLYHLFTGRVLMAAVWYGLAVHLRVYPIIYALPLLLFLDSNFPASHRRLTQTTAPQKGSLSPFGWPTREGLVFGLVAGCIFTGLTASFYLLYGMEFLNEALLYHLTRTDPRHNFSIYFYQFYLSHESAPTADERLLAFLPQALTQLGLSAAFARDLPFCMFAQTVAFVAFNKVCTAQYFVWFFCLLPLILPSTQLKLRWRGLACILVWVAGQVHWLAWAYQLEFEGKPVYLQLWVASLVFFVANVWVLATLVTYHSHVAKGKGGKRTLPSRFCGVAASICQRGAECRLWSHRKGGLSGNASHSPHRAGASENIL
ncbi:mannosyltransferase [Klebsormidium nitens]|uniref:GPI mannosyltransferase 1 n=1 Tax=Klebsormidium nitens TaxID=105231 RepID=A0A1Y1HII1_KLENI|nr:mannosyltransferase [Klebsormidium nitens]|eukprot:GAQ78300.1 mannosyltransferase [Klebsormidium nitens]